MDGPFAEWVGPVLTMDFVKGFEVPFEGYPYFVVIEAEKMPFLLVRARHGTKKVWINSSQITKIGHSALPDDRPPVLRDEIVPILREELVPEGGGRFHTRKIPNKRTPE